LGFLAGVIRLIRLRTMVMASVRDSVITSGVPVRIFIYPPTVTQYTQFVAGGGRARAAAHYLRSAIQGIRAPDKRIHVGKIQKANLFPSGADPNKKEITPAQEGDNRTEDS
jgi:hypothetical protein